MAKKKLGMASIEIHNMNIETEEEAKNYAKRLKGFINYNCKKKKWLAQAIIVISNTVGEVCSVRYANNGKRGRPSKELIINKGRDSYYKGNYNRDWHIHILIVSYPSYAFREDIKAYIDKNWGNGIAYKENADINIADYFINQSIKVSFCNENYSDEEDLKYTLKQYYYEYLKRDSARRKLFKRNSQKEMTEDKYFRELEKIESKLKLVRDYYFSITDKQVIDKVEEFI